MTRTADERSALVEALRGELEARPEIVFAYLHGSFEAGGPYRDVDVAVWLDAVPILPSDQSRYALDLSAALHLRLGVPVDVQALNDATLAFRYHAIRGRLLFTRDGEFLDDTRARIWDEYFDFRP